MLRALPWRPSLPGGWVLFRPVRVLGALAVLHAGISVRSVAAQQPPPRTKPDSVLKAEADSIRRYRLGDIVVRRSSESAPIVTSYTEERIRLADIQKRDAAVVSDFASLIPAAHIQTNSRGETLIYLRNAGERQVGVFFEGAPINVPWDNRVDLSMIPASVTGGMTVAKGVPPIEYGTNVLGGAMNLTARASTYGRSETEILGMGGTQGRLQGAITHRSWLGPFSYTAAASYAASDGIPVSSSATLPYSQAPSALRTNTDSRVTNLFARGVYNFSNGNRLGLSLVHLDAEKGVAPQSNLNPDSSAVRFWRYPNWKTTSAIATGDGYLGNDGHWKASAWVSSFTQDVDSYSSVAYDQLEEQEQDEDLTIGARAMTILPVLGGDGKVAVNWLTSRHDQRDVEFDPSGQPLPGVEFPVLVYEQHLLSFGAEYSTDVSPFVALSAGASFDAMITPKTGDKPGRDPQTDFTVTLGATWDASESTFLRFAAGRKTRFPTMRELFGTALNRFLLNPLLKPESSLLAEIGVGLQGSSFSGEVIPFVNLTKNTIDQRNVRVDPNEPTKRQRINLEGSRILGLEIVASWVPATRFTVDGHLTVTSARRLDVAEGDEYRLSEKPDAIGRLAAGYASTGGTSLFIEGSYTGRAWSPNDENAFEPLPRALAINLRVSHSFDLGAAQTLEVFARADNINDALVVPQLGLPAAGRTLAAGLTLSF